MIALPERPGIVTPLAPVTESMTPWAKTLVITEATRRTPDENCMLNLWENSWIQMTKRLYMKLETELRPALDGI